MLIFFEKEVGGNGGDETSINQGQSETKRDPSQPLVSNNQTVTPDTKSELQSVIPDIEGVDFFPSTLLFLGGQLIPILLSIS